MNLIELRDYQLKALEDIMSAFKAGNKRVLFVLPTGGGKTVIMTRIAEDLASRGLRIGVIAHRLELVDQLKKNLGHVADVFMVQSASKNPYRYDFIMIDEAHHAVARDYKRFLAAQDCPFLGVTATPLRLDGVGLGAVFDCMVESVNVDTLIKAGWLSDFKYYVPATLVDCFNGRHSRREYTAKDLLWLSSEYAYEKILASYETHKLIGKKSLIFCAGVSAAMECAEYFNAKGVRAASISGYQTASERLEILDGFRNGVFDVVTNCNLISEGFDFPAVEGVVLARPTKSLALHMQQIGRALRPLPGKSHAVIVDLVGNGLKLGVPNTPIKWSLEGAKMGLSGYDGGGGGSQYAVCPKCKMLYHKSRKCDCQRTLDELRNRPILSLSQDEFMELTKDILSRIPNLFHLRYQQLIEILDNAADIDLVCRIRNYKPGWAYYIKKQKNLI